MGTYLKPQFSIAKGVEGPRAMKTRIKMQMYEIAVPPRCCCRMLSNMRFNS